MPSSYTSNLKLALPATGELSGTWGDVVNQNITSMIEEAITAKATVSSWTSNAASITTANGVSSAGRALYLDLTGTLTATGTLTVPTANKFYIVRNGTSGGFAVTVKMASGATVSVANGTTTMVYTDGTNTLGVLGSYATLAGSETLTNKTFNLANNTLTGTTAQFNTALSDGDFATLAGSETLTNKTLTSPSISSPTISDGTANGVTYLNGSKVVTTGSALTFDGTNLGVGGTPSVIFHTKQAGSTYHAVERTTAGSEGILYVGATSSSNQIISQGASSAAKDLTFQIGSTEQMRLTSTGLGIGTSSPVAVTGTTLDIAGSAGASQRWRNNAGTSSAYLETTTGITNFGTVSTTPVAFMIGAGEKMRLDASGNLGLGVTPSAWLGNRRTLQIGGLAVANVNYGAAIGENTYNIFYNTGGTSIYQNNGPAAVLDFNNTASGGFAWRIAPSGTAGNAISFTQAMTLNSSGSLVVGSTTANRAGVNAGISVEGASTSILEANINGSRAGYLYADAAQTIVGEFRNGPLIFRTNDTERMRLDASGNLGLGVTPSGHLPAGYGGPAFQIGARSAVLGSTNDTELTLNTYYAAGYWRYIGTGIASSYRQNGGSHYWYTAPSGTAGNPISFTQAMTLDASGNNTIIGSVSSGGVGGTNGAFNLKRSSDGVTVGSFYADTSTPAVCVSSGYETIIFRGSSTERMRLDSSGNLGLGVTPSAWGSAYRTAMQIGGGSAAGIPSSPDLFELSANRYLNSSASDRYVGSGYATVYQQASGAHKWYTAPSGTAGNPISFTQAMTLDASGNLLVGTTSVLDVGRLSILFPVASANGITLQTTGTTYSNNLASFRNSSATQVGYIYTNGTTTAYGTSSDYRLKENIQPMTGALAKVAALKPCTYNWKADGSDGEGFIAHELAEVVPQCVTGEKDAVDAEGKPKYQGIDTSFLVATLTAAIQEQQTLIQTLTARVAALEAA